MTDATDKTDILKQMIQLKQKNQTCYDSSPLVVKEVGAKKGKRGEKKEPWWKKRYKSDITNLRRDINILERGRQGETGRKGKKRLRN